MPLEFRPDLWEGLVARFARYGRVPAEKNRGQAEAPVGGLVLPNRWGTAPGLWLEGPAGLAILLPGVPSEMRGLLTHEVLPRLAARAGKVVVRSRMLRTTGIPESTLAERIGDLEVEIAPLSLAYLPGVEGVDLRLTAWNLTPGEADRRLDEGMRRLAERAGPWAYGLDDTDLAARVLERARAMGAHLVTAESCTGGGIGSRLTDVPGSSDVVLGGIIAYDNRVKIEVLGVPAALIKEHGAVSEAVASAMALCAAERLGADLAIAVTGIAGPGGGTAEKPVGLVYIATAIRGVVRCSRHLLPGDRAEVRGRTTQLALFQLFQRLGDQDVAASAPM
jgi:nicotinamide-nucleotide amidase